DPHMALAEFMTGLPADQVSKDQRRLAKAGNFTFTFCGGLPRFHEAAVRGGTRMTIQEARVYWDRLFSRYPMVVRMRERAQQLAQRIHVTLSFPTGLRRDLAGPDLRPTIIMNNLVQGTAAAGLKFGLLECARRGLDEYLGVAVHDEVVACVPDQLADEF